MKGSKFLGKVKDGHLLTKVYFMHLGTSAVDILA